MSQLKSVVLISYFFPPIGMAGAGRAYGLFRYLPEFGYQPQVITVKDILYAAYDRSRLLPDDDRHITRTGSLDPSRLLYKLGVHTSPTPNREGLMSCWVTPDFKKYWAPFALKAAEKVIRRGECSVVITTSPPPSIHSLGLRLKRQHNIPWIADYRDMWVTRPIETAYHSQRQKKVSGDLLSAYTAGADKIVAVNEPVADYVGAEVVINNGADPKLFPLWDTTADKNRSSDTLRIGYLGSTDTAGPLLTLALALKQAAQAGTTSGSRVSLDFVGVAEEKMVREVFASAGADVDLAFHGYLPAEEAVRRLADSDMLLATLPEGGLNHVTGSKVFDYLCSGKPLLIIAPDNSELAKLVCAEGEKSFTIASVQLLAEWLTQALSRSENWRSAVAHSREQTDSRRERYSWRSMARKFAENIDQLSDK